MRSALALLLVTLLSLAITGGQCGRYTDAEKRAGKVDGSYLVLLKPGAARSHLAGLGIAGDVREIEIGRRVVLSLRGGRTLLSRLVEHPAVEYVEPNGLVRLVEPVEVTPVTGNRGRRADRAAGAPVYGHSFREGCQEQNLSTAYNAYGTWGLIRTSYWHPPDFHQQPYLWDYDGAGVAAYIFDTGIELNHTEFQGRAIHGMYAQEFAHEGIHDYHGHGTHVASTVAGAVYGVAKGATMVDVKVLGGDGWGLLESNIEGLGWVAADIYRKKSEGKPGKGVINMSLAYGWHSHIFVAAVQEVVDLGVTVVVAAGNNAQDALVVTPAAFDNTITVAATEREGDRFASFSNFGAIVDLAAPGVNITGAWSWRSERCDGQANYTCLTTVSGTSMASPHVAGVVARYMSAVPAEQFPDVDQEHVRAMLISTSGKGFISYENELQATAANRLLYMECGEVPPAQTTTTTTTTAAPPDDNAAGALLAAWSLTLLCALIQSTL